MKKVTSLTIAGDLLQDKRFEEALTELNRIDVAHLNEQEYAYYCILFSEANLLLSNIKVLLGNSNLRDILDKCIGYYNDNYKNGNNDTLYAKAHYLLGWLLTLQRKYDEACEVLSKSYLCHELCKNENDIPKVLNRLADVQLHAGDVDNAVKNWYKCREICNRLNRQSSVVTVDKNIAIGLYISGNIKESIEKYESIEDSIENLDKLSRFQYYLGYAMVMALKGNIKTAHVLISKTLQFSDNFKREKADYYEYLGWIYNLENSFKEAGKVLKTGILLSLEINSESTHISQTKRLLADAYVGLGEYDLAQKTAEEALVVAEKINERAEIAACYRVFAQVAMHNGDRVKTEECFNKAVEIFSNISSRYELATTHYLMATSGLYDNGERTYLLYKAKEYFESEDVKPYIEKVNAALHKTDKPKINKSAREKYNFIAKHHKTKKIVQLAESIAQSNITVLLTGETGTGKDCLAQYIHSCSGRMGELVKVNTASFPESMVESELFGHEKGAFTGADRQRRGKFELANNGTIYLNEIGDMPLQAQTRLLHVLEDKKLERLGSEESVLVTARVIAATNRDLREMIREGKFREDLYYRLNQFAIELPPLSERPDDINELTRHFLTQNGFDFENNGDKKDMDNFGDALAKRTWPGNVRELENIISRLYLTGKGDIHRMIDLLESQSLSEKEILAKTLEETDWNRSEAARRLNIAESTVRKRIKKYQLNPD